MEGYDSQQEGGDGLKETDPKSSEELGQFCRQRALALAPTLRKLRRALDAARLEEDLARADLFVANTVAEANPATADQEVALAEDKLKRCMAATEEAADKLAASHAEAIVWTRLARAAGEDFDDPIEF